MRILNLGLDNRALGKDSQTAKRIADYGAIDGIDSYVLIVPSSATDAVCLSDKAKVIPSGGKNKLSQIIGMKRKAMGELRRHRYQVITVQDAYYVGFLALCLAKLFGTGLEVQIHGFEKYIGLRKILAGFVLPRADNLRVVSERLKKHLIYEFKVRPERISVVPIFNRITSGSHQAKSDYSRPAEGKFIFFTASRLEPVKNIDLQLEALAHLVAKNNNVFLKIAGDGSESERLRKKAIELNIADRVGFVGWQERSDLDGLFSSADCFLLTSDSEGWALAVAEAGAHSLPIIMTDVGLAGEVIINEESGLVIPVGGKEKLVAAMERMIRDEDLRRKLGQGALEAVRKLPSYEDTLRMYSDGWRKTAKKIRKLLILTQKVDINDDLLGFFHDWLIEFSKHYEKITVVALGKGEYDLPPNVEVRSLGKETKPGRWNYIWNFYGNVWRLRKEYDAVFVHMNPEYVVLGGWLWKLWGKEIALWYTHKSVNLFLKIAARLADVIFTASKESYRLPYGRIEVVGHGINVAKYGSIKRDARAGGKFNIVYVGRISEIKHQELLVQALDILVNERKHKDLKVTLVGAPVYDADRDYESRLKDFLAQRGLEEYVAFAGNVPNRIIGDYYRRSDLSVNLCPTGGMDKAVLESLLSGVLVLAINRTFGDILSGYGNLQLQSGDPGELADRIEGAMALSESEYASAASVLKSRVEGRFDLKNTVKNIASVIGSAD